MTGARVLLLTLLIAAAGCESVEIAPTVSLGSASRTVSETVTGQGPVPVEEVRTRRVTSPQVGIGLQIRFKGNPDKGPLIMQDADLPERAERHILFTLDGGQADAAGIVSDFGLGAFETARLESLNMTLVTAMLPDGVTPESMQTRLDADSRIVLAGPNHFYQAMGKTRLPRQFELAGYDVKASVPQVNGRIALIDTPVATAHAALKASGMTQMIIRPKAEAAPHGTAIASLLAGAGDVPGSAPGATLMSFAAFSQGNADTPPVGETRHIALALDKALIAKADVINLSFGGPADKILARLLDEAEARGICVAAAAGNGGAKGKIPFPASHATTVAVTAVDSRKALYAQATRGDHVDVSSFGVDVLAAAPKGFRLATGTSFATAFLSSELLRSGQCGSKGGAAAARTTLYAAAADLGKQGRDSSFGYGLVQRIKD